VARRTAREGGEEDDVLEVVQAPNVLKTPQEVGPGAVSSASADAENGLDAKILTQPMGMCPRKG